MKRLLSIELQKIWKNRASKVLTLSYFVILSCIALIASIRFSIGNIKIHLAEQGIFNFPFIWHFNSFIAVFGKVFFAVIIVSMISNEYSYGTLKQNLIDGMTKKEIVLSKFYVCVLFSLVSTVFVFLISVVLGLIFSSYTEPSIIFSDMEYLVAYFVSLVCFSALCLFLGLLIKRSAFALGFLSIWFIIEVILVHTRVNFPVVLKGFLPLEAMSRLLIEPFSRLSAIKTFGQMAGIKEVKDYDVHLSTILIVMVWTVLFLLLSYTIIKKRDL
jgi:ABC-type transport system involved in multi-copper enzyme maturation permease subunit